MNLPFPPQRARSAACALAAGVALVAVCGGCAILVDAGQVQCSTDSDCTSRGGAFLGTSCSHSVCVAAVDAAPDHAADSSRESGADARLDASPDGAGDARQDVSSDAGRDAAPEASRDAGGDAADARDAADAAAGRWACLGNHPMPTATQQQVSFDITFQDFFDSAPITNILVDACQVSSDPSCELPVAHDRPDSNGKVSFLLDTTTGPFTGYFKIEPATDAGGVLDGGWVSDGATPPDGDLPLLAYLPSRIYYTDSPIATDSRDNWSLINGTIVAELTSTLQLPSIDPSLGVALLTVVDCNNTQAPGVIATVSNPGAQTVGFYVAQSLVSATATETDSSGIAGFTNVPTGAQTFDISSASTHEAIGSLSVYVLPGTVTFANVGPAFTTP